MNALVGCTGFVGGNLCSQANFDAQYHSKNIQEAFGTSPDILVYAGVRAEKFLANQNPGQDKNNIEQAFDNMCNINPKKLILISTIDVFPQFNNIDENSNIIDEKTNAYGTNRHYLEEMVSEQFSDVLIVRLPALYGHNIKKNFIYDLIHIIPSLLTKEKYVFCTKRSPEIASYYIQGKNGFYQCKDLNNRERVLLKQLFHRTGFTALNFTDSRGSFQYYPLNYLWKHIITAIENNISLLHLATEPITVSELHKYITGQEFVNEIALKPPSYNMKTKYDTLFCGGNGYVFTKDFILNDINRFVKEEIDHENKHYISCVE